jgi:hypothetical protein
VLKPLWLPLALINTAAWIIRFYISTPGKNRVAIIPRYDRGVSKRMVHFWTASAADLDCLGKNDFIFPPEGAIARRSGVTAIRRLLLDTHSGARCLDNGSSRQSDGRS